MDSNGNPLVINNEYSLGFKPPRKATYTGPKTDKDGSTIYGFEGEGGFTQTNISNNDPSIIPAVATAVGGRRRRKSKHARKSKRRKSSKRKRR